MASAGTAYVDVEAKLDEFASQIEAEVAAIDAQQVDIEAVADTSSAQAEIDAIDGGTTETEVTADTAQAQESIDGLSGSVDAVVGSLGDVVPSAGGAGGAISDFGAMALGGAEGAAALTTGLGALAVGLGASANAAMDAQVVTAQTDTLLRTTGASASLTGDEISGLSEEVMGYSGFSDEAVSSGQNLLLMFENVSSAAAVNAGVFEETTRLGADLATIMGGDVTTAIRTLGRAVDDPTAGMGRLRRAGIQLTEAQQEQITSLQESGDLLGAQQALLDIVAGKVDGLAEAYGDTLAGQIDIAKEEVDNLEEEIGSAMIPTLIAVVEPLGNVVSGLTDFARASHNAWAPLAAMDSGPLEGFMSSFLGGGLVGVLGDGGEALAKTTVDFNELDESINGAKGSLDSLDQEISDFLAGQFDVDAANRDLRASFDDLFSVLTTEGHTADDAAVALEGVVTASTQAATAAAHHGASQTEVNGILDMTRQRLEAARTAGLLTTQQFEEYSGVLDGVKPIVSTNVATPGLLESSVRAREHRDILLSTPTQRRTNVEVITERVQFDRLIRDLDAADGRRFSMQVSVNDTTPGRASGGPVNAGEAYIVGERRPELFVPDQPGTIVPRVPVMSGGGGGDTYNTINVTAGPGADGNEIAQVISDELRKLERAGR